MLDVGCGTGYGTAILAECAKQVTGIDRSAAAICFAKRRYPGVDFRKMDAQDLRFPDASFDFVFSSENFEHLPAQAAHLVELRRVLRSGGTCFIATPNPEAFVGERRNPWHTKENTYDELVRLFQPVFKEFVILENSLTPKQRRGVMLTTRCWFLVNASKQLISLIRTASFVFSDKAIMGVEERSSYLLVGQ